LTEARLLVTGVDCFGRFIAWSPYLVIAYGIQIWDFLGKSQIYDRIPQLARHSIIPAPASK
jgi:hypothetical protein